MKEMLNNGYELQRPVNSDVVEQTFLFSTSVLLLYLLIYISGKEIFVYKLLKAFMRRV